MPFCYILFSPSLNRFYTGITQDSLENRIEKHNSHSYGNHRYTAKTADWELFLAIESTTFSQARKIELYIKKMKSTAFIKKLKEEPHMLQALIEKTRN